MPKNFIIICNDCGGHTATGDNRFPWTHCDGLVETQVPTTAEFPSVKREVPGYVPREERDWSAMEDLGPDYGGRGA